MSVADFIIVGAYLVFLISVGGYLMRRQKTGTDYFLAGRALPWYLVAGSLYATDMSAYAFIAIAATGFASGILYAHFQWMAALCLLIMAVFLLPYYLRAGIFTMPEFLEKRYGASVELIFALLSLMVFVLADIPVALWSAAVLLKSLLNWDVMWIVLVVAGITAFYTISGGLRAVVYTDFLQAILILFGGAFLSWKALGVVGGWGALREGLPQTHFHAFRATGDAELPWVAVFTGLWLLGLWYWTTNQMITQRMLAAKDLANARLGATVAAVLKFTIPFLGLVPGMCAVLIYQGTAMAPEERVNVYAWLVRDLMPAGLKGLMMVTLIAALMSTIDSVLNSAATIFARDVWTKLRRAGGSEKESLVVGRVASFAFIVVGVLLAPMLSNQKQLYDYLQLIYGFTAGPIVVLFLFGILFRRLNVVGALSGLLAGVGTAVGLWAGTKWLGWPVQQYYQTAVAALVTAVVHLLVSGVTGPPAKEKVVGLTLERGMAGMSQPLARPWVADYRVWAVVVLVILAGHWLFFSPLVF